MFQTCCENYINKMLVENFRVNVIINLNNILIYIIKEVMMILCNTVLNQLKKYFVYFYQKKYCFNDKKIRFLGYIVYLHEINIEEKSMQFIYD